MLEVADALTEVLRHARPLKPEVAAPDPTLLGRVLAAGVAAGRDSPLFDKSLRDGYAVRAADCAQTTAELRVVEEVAAGAVPRVPIRSGECARIFTGAPIPTGADAVVMQEDAEAIDGDYVRILDTNVRPGQHVFRRGTEMRAGAVVLPAGTVVNPATVGVLANLGCGEVAAFPWPRVSVLATGDELVTLDEEPGPGQIRNSNGPMLTALGCRAGASVHDRGIAKDTPAALREALQSALTESDVVLIAGGVSAGKFDLVPDVLKELGVVAHFHRVRMKPGKPLLFGTAGNALVFGLPGNPASAFVGFELFVRPALRVLAGHTDPGPAVVSVPLAAPLAVTNDRPAYHPAKLEAGEAGFAVRPLEWSGAPDLLGLHPADALLVLPAGDARFDPGQPVSVIPLNV